MLGRHQSELMSSLEQVSKRGWALIEWWKLYLWYGVEKIRKEPYRDIQSRWEELDGGALEVATMPDGLLLLDREPEDIAKRT